MPSGHHTRHHGGQHAAVIRLGRAGGVSAAASVLLGLAACSNPLSSGPLDTRTLAPIDRLRSVEPFEAGRVVESAASAGVADAADAARRMREARAAFDAMERFDLPLERARAETLSNNLDLAATLVDPTIAGQRVREEEGRFDSVFTLQGGWNETDSPTDSALVGSQTRGQSITPGIRIPLRTGGTASVTLPVSRFETDNAFSTLNPSIAADLQLSLSQNLLRGAGRRATMYGLLVADYSRQQSFARTRLEVIRQLAAVDRSYWRLYAAQRAVEVRVQQWELAQAQAERAQRLVGAGRAAEIEVVRAQSGVADRVEQIIQAQNSVLLRQRELKQIVNIPGLDVDTAAAIMPVTEPDPVRYLYDAPGLSDAAVDNRMEMLELELQLAQDAARVAFERNSALPLLAMQYTYRINGLGGTEGEAFNSLAENNFEDWSVGLSAEVPLGNEQARSRVAQAVLGRLQRLATRDARRQAIRKEVYDALDQLETSWQRILASRQSVLLRARTLEAEQRQFDVGRSTSTDVLDADAALAEARLAEVSALADYQIAQVDLAFATGTLLGAARVEWAPSDPRGTPRDAESISAYHPFSGVLPGSLIGSDGEPQPRTQPRPWAEQTNPGEAAAPGRETTSPAASPAGSSTGEGSASSPGTAPPSSVQIETLP